MRTPRSITALGAGNITWRLSRSRQFVTLARNNPLGQTPSALPQRPLTRRPSLLIQQPLQRHSSSSPANGNNDTPKPPPTHFPTTNGPLQGLKILDFTRILAGPFCTQLLSDYGASVIKIETPGRGDETRSWQKPTEATTWKPETGPMSFFFASINRGKRSLTLNLKSPEGREVVRQLVSSGAVDVIVENFVPGTMDRLGIGYDELKELNPRVIFASISGYGQTGPHANRAGYDAIANAEGGLMSITGSETSGPVRAGVGLTDMATGLFLHGAILAAVLHRDKTGKGQRVDASLFETTLSLLTSVGAHWLNLGVETQRYGAGHPSVVPYNAWECGDGVFLVVAANSDKQYGVFCERLGKEEWVRDERFVSNAKRVENRELLDGMIAGEMKGKTHEEWLRILDGSGLAHGPVNTMEKAFAHPQAQAREMIKELRWDAMEGDKSWKAIGVPVKFSESKGQVRGPASRLGEHSEEVLAEAGYGKEEIESMKRKGVFG